LFIINLERKKTEKKKNDSLSFSKAIWEKDEGKEREKIDFLEKSNYMPCF